MPIYFVPEGLYSAELERDMGEIGDGTGNWLGAINERQDDHLVVQL